MPLTFEWDEDKSAANLRKHKVSFDEAKTVFNDPRSLTIFDESHSTEEQRFIDIGDADCGQLDVFQLQAPTELLAVGNLLRGKIDSHKAAVRQAISHRDEVAARRAAQLQHAATRRRGGLQAAETVVWQIGSFDKGYRELAIGENYGAYSSAFPHDVTFRVGSDLPGKNPMLRGSRRQAASLRPGLVEDG